MLNWNFPNFSKHEFVCKHCGDLPEIAESNLHGIVLYFLQPMRSHIKKVINIESGYRCYPHNIAIGGSRISYHTFHGGNKSRRPSAVDFWIADLSVEDIDTYVQVHTSTEFCGYKIYIRLDGTWLIHIDWRGYKARW